MRERFEKKLQELRVEANMTRMHLELYTGHIDAFLNELVNEFESIETQAFKRGYNACKEEMNDAEENNRDSRHTERSCGETVESDRRESTDSKESEGARWFLHGFSPRCPLDERFQTIIVEIETTPRKRALKTVRNIEWSLVYRWRFIDGASESMYQDEESDAKARLVPRQF